jgi:hypothetical protein
MTAQSRPREPREINDLLPSNISRIFCLPHALCFATYSADESPRNAGLPALVPKLNGDQ